MAKLSAFTTGSGLGESLLSETTGILKGQKIASAQASQEIAGREFEVSPFRKKLAKSAGFGTLLGDIDKSIVDIDTRRGLLKKEIDQLRLGKPTVTRASSLDEIKFKVGDTFGKIANTVYKINPTKIANAVKLNPQLTIAQAGGGLTPQQKAFIKSNIPAASTATDKEGNEEKIKQKRKELRSLFIEAQKARRRFNKEIPGLSQLQGLVGIALQKQKAEGKPASDDSFKFWKESINNMQEFVKATTGKWDNKANVAKSKKDFGRADFLNSLSSFANSIVGGNIIGSGVNPESVRNPASLGRLAKKTETLLNALDSVSGGSIQEMRNFVPLYKTIKVNPLETIKFISLYENNLERLLGINIDKNNEGKTVITDWGKFKKSSPNERTEILSKQAKIYNDTLKNIFDKMGDLPNLTDRQEAEFIKQMRELAEILVTQSGTVDVTNKGFFGLGRKIGAK